MRKISVGNYDKKYVFITGCDSGFGKLLANKLDKMGLHVFAGCLTEKGSKEIKYTCSAKLETIAIDVTSESSIKKAVKEVQRRLPKDKGLWAVVNNAGIPGVVSQFEWLTKADLDKVLAVNLYGVILVTKAFLPLVRRTPGRIVNMASIMGRFTVSPVPYTVAKFGVEGFSDAIRHELYTTGISVHVIEPGFFRTGIVNDDCICKGMEHRFEALDPEVKEYYGKEYTDTLIQRSTRLMTFIMSSKLHKVVDSYVHAVTAKYPKARYVVGWDANILFRFLWTVPEWLSDFFVCIVFPTPKGRMKKTN